MTQPTVGRIVHFYNTSLPADANNGIGAGPYAAIVSQTFTTGLYINLKVLPYGYVWDEGSVSEKAEGSTRYWTWPPTSLVAGTAVEAAQPKAEVFSRPECLYAYCPAPEQCVGACQCNSGS